MTENPYSSPTQAAATATRTARVIKFSLAFAGVLIAAFLLLMLLLPFNRGRMSLPHQHRLMCKNNLKQIGLALHNYHDIYGAFPPAYTVDQQGQPLHSWRTLILPYMEQNVLYKTIDFSKPWNDPANQTAFEYSVPAYSCPASDVPANHTTYLGVSGPDRLFHADQSRSITEVTDGLTNTMMVIEAPVDESVHWMEPGDADDRLVLALSAESSVAHFGGVPVLMADIQVRFLGSDFDHDVLQALMTINGGEVQPEF